MRKQRNVVMLPLERQQFINSTKYLLKGYETGKLYYGFLYEQYSEAVQPHYLYFTAPTIEEDSVNGEDVDIDNEVCIFKSYNGMITCLAGKGIGRVKTMGTYYKICATTNPELWHLKTPHKDASNPSVAKIPTDFIEVFFKEQGKIEKVLVEYEEHKVLVGTMLDRPKLNNNGLVKVFPVEENWSNIQERFEQSKPENDDSLYLFIEWVSKHYKPPKPINHHE